MGKKSKVKKMTKLKKAAKSVKILAKKKVVREKNKQKKPVLKSKKVKQAKKILKKGGLPMSAEKKLVKKIVKPKINQKNKNLEFVAESLFKARIKVIGIGGGGGSIVSEIGRSLKKATFVVADTDIRALRKKSDIKYFWFGEELTHGLGTGVNVDLARQAAEAAKEKFSGILKDQDITIFIASLGGGLGSGATQIFADAAREYGGITFGIFTMPFKFEGKNKYKIAQNALKPLRQSLNVSLVIPNEKIFKIIDANTAITDAFSIVNKSLIESLESLIDLIYSPGIINIDFADLRAILKGRGNSAFLNTVEESGKDRAKKTCEKILVNPLLQNNSFEAEKILFNISGSENLSMFEVEKISSHISSLNPKAKIIFGISKNPKLKNKIKTTILVTGGQTQEDAEPLNSGQPIKELAKDAVKSIVVKELEKKKESTEIKSVVLNKADKKFEGKKEKKEKKAKKKNSKPSIKSEKKSQKDKNRKPVKTEEKKSISFIPAFELPVLSSPIGGQNRINLADAVSSLSKKTIRRSALEIRKAEELEEIKKIEQEKEWEVPAFLRRVKFNK